MEHNVLDKQKLISELREIHNKLVNLYNKIFDYKFTNNNEFSDYIKEQYNQNNIKGNDQKVWNENFCHRASYTLLNKILFVRICEDKGFMRNPEDYIAGEIASPHIGEKLSKKGLQKWASVISNYTFGELIEFAFLDMKKSYNNIVLYKDNKYEILNPTEEELDLKFIEGDSGTKKIVVEFEKILSDIIEKLDTEKFDFAKTDSNILGDVYEQFMDRETRKAIGQFYTPEFVIEYILTNTVAQVDVVENPFVTVADISCGSGHFLIMAYDILREKFINNLEELRNKYSDETYEITKGGNEEYISGREYWIKENIHYHLLKHCIYGADIDSFAVQLTTINLLLKDLDNFTDELNIVECDSLIKWEDNYDWKDLKEQLEEKFEIIPTMQINLFGQEEKIIVKQKKERYKLKYKSDKGETEIKEISSEVAKELLKLDEFWSNKFDFIVGNPPYMGQKGNKRLFERFRNNEYWKNYYERKQDIYYYFIIRGIDVLETGGKLGFITPPYWLTANAAGKLKQYIIDNSKLLKIFEFGNEKIFDDAQINGNIFIFAKIKSKNIPIYVYEFDKKRRKFNRYNSRFTNDDLTTGMWNIFSHNDEEDIFTKIKYTPLGDIAIISPGIQTGADYVSKSHVEKYNLKNFNIGEGIYVISEDEKNEKFSEDDYKYIKPFYKNSDIDRFHSKLDTDRYILITNEIEDIDKYPNIKEHLLRYKVILDKRYRNFALKKADKEGKWYALYGYRPNTNFEGNKIVTPYRGKEPRFSYVDKPYYASIDVFYIDLLECDFNYHFILGILNSELILYWLDKNCKRKGDIFEFYTEPLSNIPIINADHKTQTDIANIVEDIIEKKKALVELNDHSEVLDERNIKEYINQRIEEIIDLNNELDCLEKELNKNVYNLYEVDDNSKHYIQNYLIDKNRIVLENNKDSNIKEEYINTLFTHIKSSIIEVIRDGFNNYYLDINGVIQILIDNLSNFDEQINLLKGDTITKRTEDVVNDMLGSDCYTWNMYRKARKKRNISKTFIKYYDSNYYGLAEWSDEIHKQYFMDAIEEYTVTKPNEKKAKDILKLFKDLDIMDKQDYIEIIESKINRAFK